MLPKEPLFPVPTNKEKERRDYLRDRLRHLQIRERLAVFQRGLYTTKQENTTDVQEAGHGGQEFFQISAQIETLLQKVDRVLGAATTSIKDIDRANEHIIHMDELLDHYQVPVGFPYQQFGDLPEGYAKPKLALAESEPPQEDHWAHFGQPSEKLQRAREHAAQAERTYTNRLEEYLSLYGKFKAWKPIRNEAAMNLYSQTKRECDEALAAYIAAYTRRRKIDAPNANHAQDAQELRRELEAERLNSETTVWFAMEQPEEIGASRAVQQVRKIPQPRLTKLAALAAALVVAGVAGKELGARHAGSSAHLPAAVRAFNPIEEAAAGTPAPLAKIAHGLVPTIEPIIGEPIELGAEPELLDTPRLATIEELHALSDEPLDTNDAFPSF